MAEEKKEEAKKSLNTGLIFKIVFMVANLGVTGAGVYFTYAATLGWHSPEITEESLMTEMSSLKDEELAPYIYTMDKFTVNLGGEPKRTIRLEVNLEMLAKDGFEEVMNTESRARARDRIVRLLNDKSFSDLETIQGKLFLKDQISQEINSVLKAGVVKEIYFSDFVVQ